MADEHAVFPLAAFLCVGVGPMGALHQQQPYEITVFEYSARLHAGMSVEALLTLAPLEAQRSPPTQFRLFACIAVVCTCALRVAFQSAFFVSWHGMHASALVQW